MYREGQPENGGNKKRRGGTSEVVDPNGQAEEGELHSQPSQVDSSSDVESIKTPQDFVEVSAQTPNGS